MDVSDPADPVMLEGEDLSSAIGSAEDVLVRDGRVYVAAGGPGVAVYLAGDLSSRAIHPAGAFAKDLDRSGEHLAVECTAHAYIEDEDGGWRTNQYAVPIVGGPDGGAFTTAADMGRFWGTLLLETAGEVSRHPSCSALSSGRAVRILPLDRVASAGQNARESSVPKGRPPCVVFSS